MSLISGNLGQVINRWVSPAGSPQSMGSTLAKIALVAIGSAITYYMGRNSYDFYKKRSHRLLPPLIAKSDEEFDAAFNPAFEKVKQHQHYDKFKNGLNDEKISKHFKCCLREGYCYGSQIALQREIKEHPAAPLEDLVKSIDLKDVLYYQMLHIICCAFKGINCTSTEELQERVSDQEKIFALNHPDIPKRDLQFIFKHTKNMIGEILKSADSKSVDFEKGVEIGKELVPWRMKRGSNIPLELFKENLDYLINTERDRNETITGIVTLNQKKEEGHAIGFKCSPGKFSFYDTGSRRDGGVYEYGDKNEYYEAFRRQIIDDYSGSKDVEVLFKISKFDLENDEKEELEKTIMSWIP